MQKGNPEALSEPPALKLIYIDPPYNTGNDFIYHDDFSDPLAAYLRQTGQMNEGGDMTTTAPEKPGGSIPIGFR